MEKSTKDLDIESCTKEWPLILVPDTNEQRVPLFRQKSYFPPCTISKKSFDILTVGLHQLGARAGFEFIDKPAYSVFNNDMFKGHRMGFWKPILKHGLPIYIISPLLGIIWPGDNIGLYHLTMNEVFVLWQRIHLRRVVAEFIKNNQCDCVLSYLPTLYDNIVRVENVDWHRLNPDKFVGDMKLFRKIARNSPYKSYADSS